MFVTKTGAVMERQDIESNPCRKSIQEIKDSKIYP